MATRACGDVRIGGVARVELGVGRVEVAGVEAGPADETVAGRVHFMQVQVFDLARPDVSVGDVDAHAPERQAIPTGGEHIRLRPGRAHGAEPARHLHPPVAVEVDLHQATAVRER